MEFEEEEKVVDNFIMEQAGVSYNVDFPVPTELDPFTEYQMRARTNYNDSCNDPCRNYFFGETEDYLVWYNPQRVDESSVVSRQLSVTVCPNPTSGISSFRFQVSGSELVTLKIHDMQGREVATVIDQQLTKGEYKIIFDTGELPGGIYFCRFQAGNEVQVVKMVKL